MAQQDGAPIELAVWVHPRSRRTALRFVGADLHAWVTTPPVDGGANAALIALLAATLGVARRQVTLVRGDHARRKRVAIAGLALADLRARIPADDQAP